MKRGGTEKYSEVTEEKEAETSLMKIEVPDMRSKKDGDGVNDIAVNDETKRPLIEANETEHKNASENSAESELLSKQVTEDVEMSSNELFGSKMEVLNDASRTQNVDSVEEIENVEICIDPTDDVKVTLDDAPVIENIDPVGREDGLNEATTSVNEANRLQCKIADQTKDLLSSDSNEKVESDLIAMEPCPQTESNNRVSELEKNPSVKMDNKMDVSDVGTPTNLEGKLNDDKVLKTKLTSALPIIPSKIIPRQKPKSGKFWKSERSQFRKIKKDKGQRNTFEKRLKLKEEKARNKEMANYLMDLKNKKKEEIRLKIEENLKKKEENQKKSEQFQIIKNPAKMKRMKKKQLRMLEKRDILPTVTRNI